MFTTGRAAIVAASSFVLVFAGGSSSLTGLGGAAAHDDGEPGISGDALQRARQAAVAATGGGQVTGTETGDEDSFYEVEVTVDGGRRVDVELDAHFRVVGRSGDVERPDDGPAGG